MYRPKLVDAFNNTNRGGGWQAERETELVDVLLWMRSCNNERVLECWDLSPLFRFVPPLRSNFSAAGEPFTPREIEGAIENAKAVTSHRTPNSGGDRLPPIRLLMIRQPLFSLGTQTIG